jgi:hypothetical protein
LVCPLWLGCPEEEEEVGEVREVGERPERFPVFVAPARAVSWFVGFVFLHYFLLFLFEKSCFVGFLVRLEEPGAVAISVRQLAKPELISAVALFFEGVLT